MCMAKEDKPDTINEDNWPPEIKKPKHFIALEAKLDRVEENNTKALQSQERMRSMIDRHRHDPDVEPDMVDFWEKVYKETADAIARDESQVKAKRQELQVKMIGWLANRAARKSVKSRSPAYA
jgi:hypothetical protein